MNGSKLEAAFFIAVIVYFARTVFVFCKIIFYTAWIAMFITIIFIRDFIYENFIRR